MKFLKSKYDESEQEWLENLLSMNESAFEKRIITTNQYRDTKGAIQERLNELRQKDKPKLLVIELDDIDSVPTVYYKGEKVSPKTKVGFKWQSKTSHSPDSIDIEIEHVDTDSTGVLNTIKKRKGWGEHR
jgi:hypothetical protein